MTNRGKLIVLSIATLLLAHAASTSAAWESPRYGSAFMYSSIPILGQPSAWSSDYGIARGRCNASLVSAMVGGPRGTDSDSDTRSVATLRGPVLSDTPAIDAVDRGCMGHALELAPSFVPVRWTNPHTRGTYTLVPMRRLSLHGNQCRLFSAQLNLDGNGPPTRGTACRQGRGNWYMI
jgi:surface antigen